MMEFCNMLWRSTHHPTIAWHTNALTFMLIILEFQFTFLMEVCLNPIINFFIYMFLYTYGFSPRLYFFQSCTNIKYINCCHTQTLLFPIYGVRIPTQHSKPTYIHGNTITEYIPHHNSERVTSKTPVIGSGGWRGGH